MYEKESMAVVHALEIWEHHFMGGKLTTYMHHQSLPYFLTQPKIFEKHLRLAQLHFTIFHSSKAQCGEALYLDK